MILPFKIKSIEVVNTGLGNADVEGIVWIDETRIKITNQVNCIYDSGAGGSCMTSNNEFEWSFTERDFTSDAYVLIKVESKWEKIYTTSR